MAARSIASATLTWGLVSVPVKLFTAASAEGVKFSMITPGGNRVKQKYVDSVTGEEVTHDQCSKGFEHIKDQFVVFKPEEIKAMEAEKSPCIEIKEFVPVGSFDALEVEKTYYLGVDKGGDKGYCLLAKAMQRTGKVAVARYNSRGREHLIVVKPYKDGLVMHQMFYSDEVRDFSEITGKVAKVNFHPAEEEMADKLIETLTTDAYHPENYSDGYVARVKIAVDQKVNGQEVKVASAPSAPPVTDLLAALKASLEGKKPTAQA